MISMLVKLRSVGKIKLRTFIIPGYPEMCWEYVIGKHMHTMPDPTIGTSEWTALPIFSTNYKIFYKSPEFQVLQTFFIDVLTYELWSFWLGSAFLIGFISALYYRFVIRKDSVLSIFMVTFVLSGQGMLEDSRRSSWRIYAVFVGFLAFVMTSAFDIFLTTYLLLQSADLPITTMDDILKTNYSICINPKSDISGRLLNSNWASRLNTGKCTERESWYYLKNEPYSPIAHTCDTENIVSMLKHVSKQLST